MPDVPTTAIADALREATPGPWHWSPDIREHYRRSFIAKEGLICTNVPGGYGVVLLEGEAVLAADAHLIANAPTWLAQLLAALEAKDAQIERLKEWASGQEAAITSYEAALEVESQDVEPVGERRLIDAGNHVAGLLNRCKSQHGPHPTDDTINSVVTAWHNAAAPVICHAPEVPPEPWPKAALRYRLLRLIGR